MSSLAARLAPAEGAADRAPVRLPLALATAASLGSLAFVTPPPMFPAMSRSLDIEMPLLGLVMSVMLLAGAVLSLVTGPLADRHGMRRLLTVGAGAATACLLGFGLAPGYGVLLGIALFGGLANATLPGLSLAVARAALDEAPRQRAIGWITAGSAASAIVGVPLLTLIGDLSSWRIAFVAAGGATLGMGWFLVSSLPMDLPAATAPSGRTTLLAAWRVPLRHRPTLRLYGITVLRSITWYGLLGYFGAYLDREVGLGATGIGIVYMIGGGGYFAGSLLSSRLLARLPARLLIGLMNGMLALAILLMYGVVQDPAVAVVLIVVAAFSGAASQVATVTLLSTKAPGGAGTIMALNGALTNLGSATGGALGGALLAGGGFGALAVILPVFGLATLPLLVSRSGRPVTSPAPATSDT